MADYDIIVREKEGLIEALEIVVKKRGTYKIEIDRGRERITTYNIFNDGQEENKKALKRMIGKAKRLPKYCFKN